MDANQLDLVVGRVADVSETPGTRAPSFRLRLDLGPRGRRDAVVEPAGHGAEALRGALVVVALEANTATVLAARSHAGGMVLVRPERDVEPGTVVA